jgi:hypothetical protein
VAGQRSNSQQRENQAQEGNYGTDGVLVFEKINHFASERILCSQAAKCKHSRSMHGKPIRAAAIGP